MSDNQSGWQQRIRELPKHWTTESGELAPMPAWAREQYPDFGWLRWKEVRAILDEWQNAKDALPPAPQLSDWPDAVSALQPFAEIGAWLFARPEVPDDTPVVDLLGINGLRGALTRGQFKAAYTALDGLTKRHVALPPAPEASPSHVCGLAGYDQMRDGECPACKANWQAYIANKTEQVIEIDEDGVVHLPVADASPAKDPIAAAVNAQLDPLKDELVDIGHKLEEQANSWTCTNCGTAIQRPTSSDPCPKCGRKRVQ